MNTTPPIDVAEHQGLIFAVANKCRSPDLAARGLEIEDVEQSVALSFCNAARTYDPGKGPWLSYAFAAGLWAGRRVINRAQPLAQIPANQDGQEIEPVAPAGPDPDAREVVEKLLGCLDSRHRAAVVLRFGLDGQGGRQWPEIGESLGVCHERARQLCARALRRMREAAGA